MCVCSNITLINVMLAHIKYAVLPVHVHIFSDVDAVNSYYAKISTNSDYSIHNVIN